MLVSRRHRDAKWVQNTCSLDSISGLKISEFCLYNSSDPMRPSSWVNGQIKAAFDFFKSIILDAVSAFGERPN